MALGAGLREAHKTAQVAADNRLMAAARDSVDLAMDWLTQARRLLAGSAEPDDKTTPGQ
jgi:hypothetical protein